jgi:hypothetical protein
MFPALAAGIAKFIPHIAIAGIALGGLALAVDLATREERKRTKQAKDRAEAATLTTDKRQSLADFFGTSLSSKYFQPAKVNEDMTDGASLAVQELKLNEEFKKQYATTITALKEGTNEQVKVMLQSLSLGLSADFAPDQIAVIVQALKEEAGKTSFQIDFAEVDVRTETGRKNAVDLVRDRAKALAPTGSDAETTINAEASNLDMFRAERDRARAAGATKDTLVSQGEGYAKITLEQLEDRIARAEQRVGNLKSETKSNIEETVGSMTSSLTALRVAFDNGEISQSEYLSSVSEIKQIYKDLLPYQKQFAGGLMFDALPYPEDVKKAMSEIKDAAFQFDLYTLSISDSTKALEFFNEQQAILNNPILTPERKKKDLEDLADRLSKALGLILKSDDDIEKPLTEVQKKYKKITDLLSNYQKGLEIISLKEDGINKTYDERLDALKKVQEANDIISQQQQDQLDIADKITSGDVAGAARAVQQARQNNASNAFGLQESALNTARDNELAALTDPSGRTRKALEELIGKEEMEKLLLEFNNGDKVNAATGGHIRGKGTGTSDSIPAMLSNGEYVIRAKAAQALGIDTLDKMNHAEKFYRGGPVNIAKYATGGLVGRYAKGGYASSDERRMASGMSSSKKSGLPDWMKWVPGLNMLTTGSAVANAMNTKTVNKKDAKKDALYKKGGFEGFLAGFEGMMGDMGTNPFVKGLGAAISSNPYTDFLMSTLSLPVNMIGSGVNSSMNILSDAGKAANGKMGLGNFLGSTMGNIGRSFVDPFVSTYGHMADPNTEFKTGFGQATDTVIKNKWFGTDTAEGRARARVFGGGFELLADPLNYIGVGAAAKVAGIGSKVSKAASKVKSGAGKITTGAKNTVESFKFTKKLLKGKFFDNPDARLGSLGDVLAPNPNSGYSMPSFLGNVMFPEVQGTIGNRIQASVNQTKAFRAMVENKDVLKNILDGGDSYGMVDYRGTRMNRFEAIQKEFGPDSFMTEGMYRLIIEEGADAQPFFRGLTDGSISTSALDTLASQANSFSNAPSFVKKINNSILKRHEKYKTFFPEENGKLLDAILSKQDIDKLPPNLQALVHLFAGTTRSKKNITQMMHPANVPVDTGRVYGPGTYFAQLKRLSGQFAFGPNYYKMSRNPMAIIKTLRSKGYITPDKMQEEMGMWFNKEYNIAEHATSNNWRLHGDTDLNAMKWEDPFIQHLISQGYLGYKHGDALTNWMVGTSKEFRFRGAKPTPQSEIQDTLARLNMPENKLGSAIKKLPKTKVAKDSAESSPIMRGVFDGNKGIVPGISSIGKRDIGGVSYYLKKLGSKKQQDAMMRAASSADYYPEGAVRTGLQEYFVANTLRKLGINTPDLKIFADMSSIENGLVLGSRALPEMQSMDTFSHKMSLLRGDQEQADLFMKMMDTGVGNFAQRDAVINALLGNTDAHFGNVMFNSKTGEMSILDFARLSSAGGISKSAYHIGVDASSNVKRLQSKIQSDSALKSKTMMNLIGKTSIPHTIEEVPFGVPGSNEVLRLGQRTADMKPMARSLADAFGFDLSGSSLPSDFAKNNPVLKSVIDALKTTNIEKGFSAKVTAESQQQMLEAVFQNIKSVLGAKDATFKYAGGGMVGKPKYFANGGMVGMYARGGDVVPSMLTPGEFVVSQPAVRNFGVDNLKAINNGTRSSDSVYNYSVNLNVNGSNANAEDIARAVSRQIERVNSQRIRGTRV